MGTATNLPGVTLDPKDEAGLSQAFGVTSNAEELIKSNRARYTPEQRRASIKDEHQGLTDSIHELDDDGNRVGLKSDLADHLGHPVESARVRGSGRDAAISYVFVGDRGSLEHGIVAYADVFGSAKDKRAARKARSESKPDQAAQQAADEVLEEAEQEAEAAVREAQEKAEKILADARAKAEEELAKATADAAEARAKAAEEAPKAADKAKQQAARSGSSGGRSRSGGSSRSK